MTLGVEKAAERGDDTAAPPLMEAGLGLLQAIAATITAAAEEEGKEVTEASAALAAALGEALVVAVVVTKGQPHQALSPAWEGWLAALPPPAAAPAAVEATIEAGLAWVAAAAAVGKREDDDRKEEAEEAEDGASVSAFASALPALGTGARAALLAGARTRAQVRYTIRFVLCACVRCADRVG